MAAFIEVRGDILDARAEALVNPVNCVGVMGAGLAKEFAARYPEMLQSYRHACRRRFLLPGSVHVYEVPFTLRYIINFPTKDRWREPSTLEYIEQGLVALVNEVRFREIRSIAIPALGCGLGGLRYTDVRPRIESAFQDVPADVHLYQPPRM
jgi:O-acetyl-ADP-ribose deacetylase (regulator of RNase III)